MRGIIRGVADHHCELLASAWEFCSTPADTVGTPADMGGAAPSWMPTNVPNTVASSLRELGKWTLAASAHRFDADDWWFRCRFDAPKDRRAGDQIVLGFDGLASVAEVWLNGESLLIADNMFLAHEITLPRVAPINELVLRFRALDSLLTAKRPRPRWRAPMIENQQLRWFRTTLLGRTPGWSPPAAAVGPWRDVWIERRRGIDVKDLSIRTSIENGAGVVALHATLESLGSTILGAQLILERGAQRFVAELSLDRASHRATARLLIPSPALWWPHTHGDPATYTARIEVQLEEAGQRRPCAVSLAPLGFRTVEIANPDGGFQVRVNGERVFCRGACWTPPDVVSLRATRAEYIRILDQVRSAGMNMLRVGGTMVYESEEFLDLCDEYGILVWQDLMFANMDYPDGDAGFVANVTAEIRQQAERLSAHACVAVICGNSEVEQQAAMWGATRERWQPRLFHEIVPALLAEMRTGVPYWPSSAHGGAFPHQVNQGTTSYYGVGAYLRPLEDARRAELRFATECLGFANVPEERALAAMPQGLALRVHHPLWKQRVPRDLGAGWDFDDVRNFYLKTMFELDPSQLCYTDHDRYLRLSRIVTGEVMAASYSEWRRGRSTCNGALVWFLRDLWEGAGWGVIDALGEPKAALHALRRVLQPVMVAISDEGNNGLALHVVNETAQPLETTLSLTLYRGGEVIIAQGRRDLRVDARGALEITAAELLDGFHDLSYAYRFGPPAYDVAIVALSRAGEAPFTQATYFPAGLAVRETRDIGLRAVATPTADGHSLKVSSRAFARWVSVHADGYVCDDQYFHLPPGAERLLALTPLEPGAVRALRGQILAVNASAPTQIELTP
jgi:beta-mannosidase